MALLLLLETATKQCSVALAQDGEILALQKIAQEGYSHAEKLHLFIRDVLQEANRSFAQLDAIAVSKGPGSYTGLRIGNAAAKGLCFAVDIPLIAIDTLAILAKQAQGKVQNGLIVPMLDARRMEVYSAIYDENLHCLRPTQAEIIDEQSFRNYQHDLYFVGDCQDKIKTVLQQPNFYFLPEVIYPSAQDMGLLSEAKFNAKEFEDLAYYEPFYLKDFVATTPKQKL